MGNKFWQSCVFLKMHSFNLLNTFGHSLTPLKDNFTSWAAHYNWKCFDLWLKCRIFLTWNKWCKMALTFQVDVINMEIAINISQSFTKHVWMFKVSVPILILIFGMSWQIRCCFRAKILHLPCDGWDCWQREKLQS